MLAACTGRLPVATLDVGGHPLRAEIVANEADRARGLMFRDSLGADAGMLFIYPDQQIRRFWMKDTRIPLSIAFADRAGTIVWIADMEPFDLDSTSSMLPAKFALEVNQGWFAEHAVEKGDRIEGIPEDPEVR
jgi:uncharacterized protein